MTADGTFGSIKINPQNLQRLMLTANKGKKRICHQPCDYNLLELLTKRYNPKKTYSPQSMDLFRKLIRHAEVPIKSTNAGKFKHIISQPLPADEEPTGGCRDCQKGGCASCGTDECAMHG